MASSARARRAAASAGPRTLEFAKRLLRDLSLSPADVEGKYTQATDPDYWRRLCPNLTVSPRGYRTRHGPAAPDRTASEIARFQRSGYFEAGPVMTSDEASRMRAGVSAVQAAGWPAVFSFVYDEFWRVWSAPPITGVLRASLGKSYGLIPHIWCWHVPSSPDAAGWPPHVDGWNRPQRISVWVALGDATLDNGCMYVIPRERTASMPMGRILSGRETLRWRGWAPLLHGCRALPVAGGSAVGWDFQTIHWGSVCHQSGEPRVSIAAYFMPVHLRRRREERALFDPRRVPNLRKRLWAIGFSTRYFRPNDARNLRFSRLASRLMRYGGVTGRAGVLS